MSLRVEDWKKVLDQPKNLGLKAGGGTGIGKALLAVDGAKAAFDGEKLRGPKQAEDHGALLVKALEDLIKKCNEVIGKHRKLFTTACDYLQKDVVAAANREIQSTHHQVADILDQKRKESSGKAALEEVCKKAEQAIPHSKDIHELMAIWTKYKKDVLAKIAEYEHALGRQGVFRNDIRRMESIQVIEANARAFEFLRNRCAEEARLMGGAFVSPYA